MGMSKMHDNLVGDVLNNLITVLLNVDTDGDMILGDAEIDSLITQLEGLHGVALKNDVLKEFIISHGRSVDAIMDVCREFLSNQDTSHDTKREKLGLFVETKQDE